MNQLSVRRYRSTAFGNNGTCSKGLEHIFYHLSVGTSHAFFRSMHVLRQHQRFTKACIQRGSG